MSSPTTNRSALTFSLRALLILVTLIGVGLALFRWPWVEQGDPSDPFGPDFTTYRRSWNGKPLRHGMCQSAKGDMEEFYVDDEKVWQAIYNQRKLISKHSYRAGKLHGTQILDGGRKQETYVDGVLHGPYSDLDGRITGEYRQGEPHGQWRTVHVDQGQEVVHLRSFDRGTPHGPWSWTSADKVLQSCRFEAGKLVEWNGKPLREAVRAWLTEQQLPAEMIADLDRPLGEFRLEGATLVMGQIYEIPHRFSPRILVLGGGPQWWSELLTQWNEFDQRRTIGEAFVEAGLLNSCALFNHYGVVCQARIAPIQLVHQDLTGAAAIRFPPSSKQESDWQEKVAESQFMNASLDLPERFTKLFEDTSIPIELNPIYQEQMPLISLWMQTGTTVLLQRRLWFELMLHRESLRVELQDGVLKILPGTRFTP